MNRKTAHSAPTYSAGMSAASTPTCSGTEMITAPTASIASISSQLVGEASMAIETMAAARLRTCAERVGPVMICITLPLPSPATAASSPSSREHHHQEHEIVSKDWASLRDSDHDVRSF